MFALSKQTARLYPAHLRYAKMSISQLGSAGKGSGKGVVVGGFIRDAETPFGKKEAAKEEEYFYKQQRELLYKMKNEQIGQVEFHRKQINELEQAVQRHKESLGKLGFAK